MSDYCYRIFDSFSRDCLKKVLESPRYKNYSAAKITDLVFFGNVLTVDIEIPYDALLRIYQFNYDKIQEKINN